MVFIQVLLLLGVFFTASADEGVGVDPFGIHATADDGIGIDPNGGIRTTGDEGNGFDPHGGRRAGCLIDPNGCSK